MSSKTLAVDAALDSGSATHAEDCVHETSPANGLVLDKTAPDRPSSIAAAGLALVCYPVSVERGSVFKRHIEAEDD